MPKLPRLSYANVTATLALFFALSGTAVAGAHLLITGADVQNGSLTGADLANNSIELKKLTPHAVTRLRGATGPAGTPGVAGATGTPGAGGAPGAAGTMISLAAHAVAVAQTLPDDSAFHTVWSTQFNASANEVFIITGQIGGESTVGCPDGDYTYTTQVMLDGSPYAFTGALMSFSPGTHTLAYEARSNCSVSGFPVHEPDQEAILIPFNLP